MPNLSLISAGHPAYLTTKDFLHRYIDDSDIDEATREHLIELSKSDRGRKYLHDIISALDTLINEPVESELLQWLVEYSAGEALNPATDATAKKWLCEAQQKLKAILKSDFV